MSQSISTDDAQYGGRSLEALLSFRGWRQLRVSSLESTGKVARIESPR